MAIKRKARVADRKIPRDLRGLISQIQAETATLASTLLSKAQTRATAPH